MPRRIATTTLASALLAAAAPSQRAEMLPLVELAAGEAVRRTAKMTAVDDELRAVEVGAN